MSRTTFVLQAVVAALVACAVAHGQSLCSLQNTCGSCLANSGCGWAADLLMCYSGTSSGPTPPIASSNWIWGSSANCPMSTGCSSYGSCVVCNIQLTCYWDGSSCVSGTNPGTTCPPCTYSSCSSCNANTNCMWDGVSCVPGSNVGSVCFSDSSQLIVILLIIFVPSAVFVAIVFGICWWYRRVYLRRAAPVVVTDAGLAVGVTSPYVAVQTGTGINTAVY